MQENDATIVSRSGQIVKAVQAAIAPIGVELTSIESTWNPYVVTHTLVVKECPRKPPIGLRPRSIAKDDYRRDRMMEIQQAISRYTQAGKEIPAEWAQELSDLSAARYSESS